MNDFTIHNTAELQELSLTNYMAALGYEPVYSDELGLIRFRQPRFQVIGRENISVNLAIKMHNRLSESTFFSFRVRPGTSFKDFISKYDNIDRIVELFAGTCKIVQQVKANFSNKKGFMVHDHNVKFMTKLDKRQHGFHVGL